MEGFGGPGKGTARFVGGVNDNGMAMAMRKEILLDNLGVDCDAKMLYSMKRLAASAIPDGSVAFPRHRLAFY